jgi:hypothetical protein
MRGNGSNTGWESVGPTHHHATLDTWFGVQNHCCHNLWRGYRSDMYKENHPTTQHILDHIQQQTGSQSNKLSEYVGYDDDTQCYRHAPGPIKESETWRIIGGNANGLRPYRDMVDLLSIAKRTRSLQAGTSALSETNMGWHKHELRNNMDKVLIKAFGAARTEYGTSSDKFETSNYQPVGTLYSALGPWANRVCASGRETLQKRKIPLERSKGARGGAQSALCSIAIESLLR